jgi:hypothetical protein
MVSSNSQYKRNDNGQESGKGNELEENKHIGCGRGIEEEQ